LYIVINGHGNVDSHLRFWTKRNIRACKFEGNYIVFGVGLNIEWFSLFAIRPLKLQFVNVIYSEPGIDL